MVEIVNCSFALSKFLNECPEKIINIKFDVYDRKFETNINNLNLSKCINLIKFEYTNHYNITELDFSDCINLKILIIKGQFSKQLDLTKNINLTSIYLSGYTKQLDLTKNINLTTIDLSGYTIPIDLTKNINLTDFNYGNDDYKYIPTLLKYNGIMTNNGLKNIKNKFEKQLQEQNQKIEKLEEQLQNLTDIISNLKTNTSYFT
jgi:hypothetical protein